MSVHSEIDDTLRRLGSVEPPPGLEGRVNLRLQNSRQPFFRHGDAHHSHLRVGGQRCSVCRGLESCSAQPGVSPCRGPKYAGGQYSASRVPGLRWVWHGLGGARTGRAGSGAAHAG